MNRYIIAVVGILGVVAIGPPLLTGCGTVGPGDGAETVLTIEEALAADPGQTVKVTGAVLAKGAGADMEVVLASAMLESYPPQAGGATLPLKGLDLESLVGLTSTADNPDLAQVTWSDYWVVLEGVIDDGVLEVQKTPRVVEVTSAEVRLRFSPVTEPLQSGEQLWWAFDVKNLGDTPLQLTFSSGQRADVILGQDGVEKYRWSADKVFTAAMETVTVEPGRALSIVLNDRLPVAPGNYDVVAVVTASVGPEGATTVLPDLKTTITVY